LNANEEVKDNRLPLKLFIGILKEFLLAFSDNRFALMCLADVY